MKLFSDRGSDPRRARGLVVSAEVAAAAAVVVAGIGGPAVAGGAVALAAILIWAMIPRLAGGWLERLSPGPGAGDRESRRFRASALAAAFVALAGVVATAWLPAIGASGGVNRILIILFWAAGFFVFDPGCRRGFEILGAAVVVQGIWWMDWSVIPVVALAVFGFGLSSALRRQLDAGVAPQRRRRVLVQNAAVLALLLAVVVSAVFLGLGAAARAVESVRGGGGSDGATGGEPEPEPAPGAAGQPAGGRRPRGGPPSGMGDLSRGGVGLRNQSDSGDEDSPDPVVLRIEPGISSPQTAGITRWSPESTTLWKARTFATFDPQRQEWLEAAFDERLPLTFPGCRALVDSPVSDEIPFHVRMTVAAERLGVLVLPYATDEVDLSGLGPPVADLHTNSEGDLASLDKPLVLGDRYDVRFRPMEAGDPTLLRPLPGSSGPTTQHLEIPAAVELRMDLALVAARIFENETSLEDRVDRLHRWFAANLAHIRTVSEIEPPETLADFLLRSRVGDCRHLATAAALLLRAGGVPTRLAAGFAGAVPDPVAGGWTVSQSQAHAWIEVRVPGRGFVPLDPSEWVSSGLPPVPSATGATAPVSPVSGAPAAPPPESPGPSVLLLGLAAALAMIVFVVWRPPRRRAEDGDGEEEAPARDRGPGPALDPRLPPFLPSTPAGRLVLAYDDLQHHLARSDLDRLDHETPVEHAARLAAGSGARCQKALDTLMPLFYTGLYAQDPLTESDASAGHAAITALRRTF